MARPFKMKGSPMQRNFGIGGSPLHNKEEKLVNVLPTVDVHGGKGGSKKKYSAYEESIQEETDIVWNRIGKSTDRSKIEAEIRKKREAGEGSS